MSEKTLSPYLRPAFENLGREIDDFITMYNEMESQQESVSSAVLELQKKTGAVGRDSAAIVQHATQIYSEVKEQLVSLTLALSAFGMRLSEIESISKSTTPGEITDVVMAFQRRAAASLH